MAIATRVGQVKSYVLREDRVAPESEQTVFQLRTLSARVKAMIEDSMVQGDMTAGEDGVATKMKIASPGTGSYTAVRYGVTGWSNLKDHEGNVVEPVFVDGDFGLKILSNDSMDRISGFIGELFGAVMRLNRLDDEAEGESGNG